MERSARLYNCVCFHHQVMICSHCDRGNIYCSKSCAERTRNTSLRAAGKRYQSTRRGRFKHAERQRRYRSRRKKVTHQGSPGKLTHDPLAPRSEVLESVVIIEDKGVQCHFCRRLCSPFLRLDYMYRTRPPLASDQKVIHRPPRFWAQAP